MTDLDRIHVIDKSTLSGKNYFASLLTQGRVCGLLSDSDAERIQIEGLSLLAKQTEKYNHGDSSSIRVEKAQDLLNSIFYVVGLVLKAYPSPEDALEALKQGHLEALFGIGQKRIQRKMQAARVLHQRIKKHLFQTKNVFFRSTVVDGINGFFKLYRPEFSAQEIHITADYPTFFGVTDLAGIEFIERYLQNIAYENRFCLYFSANKVHHLLCGLDENYQQILMNLYEPILTAAVCCVLTDQPVRELCSDIDALKAKLTGRSADEIAELLLKASDELSTDLSCTQGLNRYIKRSIPKIAASIEQAIRLGHLETVVLTPTYPEDKPQIILSYGERMSDLAYTKVLDELMWCEEPAAKAEIILSKVHSLGDLLEILRDSESTKEELVLMFSRFPLEAIAALMVQYPNGDFLSDERESNIYAALQQFTSMLPPLTKTQLEKAVKAITMQ